MANSSLSLTSLDFGTLRSNLKSYLASQPNFKDYNFDGSNMGVLMDIMSYNTFINSFYLNMVASEMFMDSAQKLDSVVSHAKELNYVPKSYSSSIATIDLTVDAGVVANPFIIPKGTLFSGTNSNGSFTFTTAETVSYTSTNSTYTANGLMIYEGTYVTDSFVVDDTIENQKFLLQNENADVSSLSVTVTEINAETTTTTYKKVDTLFNLTADSKVYFIQAAQNGQYEILFGDGTLGYVPKNGSVIELNYRTCVGPTSDGVAVFTLSSDLGVINGLGSIGAATITTVDSAASGELPETIESIRKLAPRYFATQQRAIASDDYASLVRSEFGGKIADINVYGGELLNPKQYGRVAVCLKPTAGTIAPDYLKNQIVTYLKPYIALPNRVLITDPDYMYLKIDSTVQYDPTITTKTPSELSSNITAAIKQFSSDHLEMFDNDFRYSKFVTHIDSIDSSIVSNSTDIKITKRISPLINYSTSYILDFNNPAEEEGRNAAIGYVGGNRFYDEPMVTSSPFTYIDDTGTALDLCYYRDDNYGVMVIYRYVDGAFKVVNNAAGEVDYATGIVKLNNLKTSSYGDYISIYMAPKNKDVIANNDKIIIVDLADVDVSIITHMK
jgi:hypothetical protein